MQRTFRHPALLVLAWLASCATASAQDLLIKRTGISLPTEVLGFARGDETDYEANATGGGTSVSFGMAGKFTATLYAYTANLEPIPQSIKDASAASVRELVVQEILEAAKNADPKDLGALSRRTMSEFINTKNSPGTAVSFDGFIVYPGGRATNSFLFMWVARSHLWKLRITRLPGPLPESPIPFAFFLIDTTLK